MSNVRASAALTVKFSVTWGSISHSHFHLPWPSTIPIFFLGWFFSTRFNYLAWP